MKAQCSLVLVCLATLSLATASERTPSGPESQIFGSSPSDVRLSAGTLGRLSESLQELAERVTPSVVQIEVTWFGPPDSGDERAAGLILRQQGIGAGVIVDQAGYILTNAHVVEGGQRIRVHLPTPARAPATEPSESQFRTLEARIIGADRDTDLALLKVEAENLPLV